MHCTHVSTPEAWPPHLLTWSVCCFWFQDSRMCYSTRRVWKDWQVKDMESALSKRIEGEHGSNGMAISSGWNMFHCAVHLYLYKNHSMLSNMNPLKLLWNVLFCLIFCTRRCVQFKNNINLYVAVTNQISCYFVRKFWNTVWTGKSN